MSPSTLLDLEEVPFAILEAVKARILASRRNIGKPPPSTRPRPQFRKFGASSKGWRKPQHGAGVLGGDGWLLVPSGPYNSAIGGFETITGGLPDKPFVVDEAYDPQDLVYVPDPPGPALAVLNTLAGYSTHPDYVSAATFDAFTFEFFVGGAKPTEIPRGIGIVLNIITETGDPYHTFFISLGVFNEESQRTIVYQGDFQDEQEIVLDLGYVPESTSLHAQMRHFALVRSAQSVSVYIAGSLVGSVESKPTGRDPVRVDITLQGGSDTVDNAYKVKGIRLTPGQALYSGSSFTPPTDITDLE